jgi:deoxyribose-phosphate aldolase
MYIEYYTNTIDEKDVDIKKKLEELVATKKIAHILCQPYYAKIFKKTFPNLKIGSFIDYPISGCEPHLRPIMIQESVQNNIDYIAITLPYYYLVNKKYDKLREDIKKNIDAAQNKEIRYILEYRKFDHSILSKACEILMTNGITTIYPSSGFFLDNIEDNIIACSYLHKKTSINTIINANAWTQKHFHDILQSQMFGFSCNNSILLKSI